MNKKYIISGMLVFMLMASVFLPLASADGSDEGIDLAVTIKEPKPAIGISVDTDSIDFGEMMPGQTSDSHAVTVANIGLTAVDIDLSVSDSGDQDVFASGITANGAGWADYFASIATAPYPVNPETSFDVALTLPETILARGDFSGSMVVFATAVQDTVAPEADFSADVTNGNAPLTVQFSDASTNTPTSWAWDFDDDGMVDSNDQNPDYIFNAAGTYTISLTVSNSAGSDTVSKAGYITVASSASDFTYTTSSGKVTITGYKGTGGNVFIPSTIGGNPVTTIKQYALTSATITSVTTPSTVTSIQGYAFGGAGINSITINSGTINGYTFNSCTALKSIIINSGTIKSYAFDGLSALTSVTLGSGVTSISGYTFNSLTALTSITFLGNAPTIASYWAQNCPNLVLYYYPSNSGFTTPTWKGFPCYPL